MAAMGAAPRWALLGLALPESDETWLAAFSRGFLALAEAHRVDLIGGDTTRGARNICVTILGEIPSGLAITRSGAKPGDHVYVSGSLGDAALAVAALKGKTKLDASSFEACRSRLDRPTPRLPLGERLRGIATAMLDVSDGLIGDLGHILDASKKGAVLDLAAVPRSAVIDAKLEGSERALSLSCLLAGGDDYELCFTAPPMSEGRIQAIAEETALPLSRIGFITAERGLVVRDEKGHAMSNLPRAYDHFVSEP
jgi:thiamine-monophosphate kinase